MEFPTGTGYRRIQGALQNLGHRVARSTIATMLRAAGIGPVPERPRSWRAFLAAHWGVIAAADFFTTEVWTARGLVTYYTLFVIELASRRVHLVGSTPHPDDAFVCQVARVLTAADDGILRGRRIFICDRDAKWSATCRQTLADGGIRVVQTPFQTPNCNAHAERFVRSTKEECLNQVIVLGEAHLRRTLTAFVAHYTRNGIAKAWTIGSSRRTGSRHRGRPVPSVAGCGSAGSCAIITAPHDGRSNSWIVRA